MTLKIVLRMHDNDGAVCHEDVPIKGRIDVIPDRVYIEADGLTYAYQRPKKKREAAPKEEDGKLVYEYFFKRTAWHVDEKDKT